MLRHEVIQEIGELDQIVWEFETINHTIYLERMLVMHRETRRHKFKLDLQKSYSRLEKRDYRLKEEPETPIEISIEAVHATRKKITFKKWT
jgi:hypothetical protein